MYIVQIEGTLYRVTLQGSIFPSELMEAADLVILGSGCRIEKSPLPIHDITLVSGFKGFSVIEGNTMVSLQSFICNTKSAYRKGVNLFHSGMGLSDTWAAADREQDVPDVIRGYEDARNKGVI